MQRLSAPAPRLIGILNDTPSLMNQVRSMIAEQATQAGREVDESQITDAAIRARITDDLRARYLVTQFLAERGYLDENELGPAASADPLDQSSSVGGGRTNDALSSGETRTNDSSRNGSDEDVSPRLARRGDSSGTRNSRAAERPQPARRADGDAQSGIKRVAPPYANVDALNDLYSQLKVDNTRLQRFGMDLFKNTVTRNTDTSMDLPGGADYVLGPGDGVTITLSGATSQSLKRSVDREGRITLPEAGNVMVAGQTIDHAQKTIEHALARQFNRLHVDLSLTRVRSIRVYVVGDVVAPGGYDISSLSTPLSAMIAAGGPTARGSMRAVRHMRGDQLVETIDLYDFMLRGVRKSSRLQAGDVILVPPVGPQVTIGGAVRRPAIYELRDERDLNRAIELAGGVLVTGAVGQITVERVQAHEGHTMLSPKLPAKADGAAVQQVLSTFKIQDGDKVRVGQILPYSDQAVYLAGHVVRPGKFSYFQGMKITDLIHSYQELMPEPSDHAEIVRLSPPDLRPVAINFNLGDALAGDVPIELKPFDTIRIFGRYEIDPPTVAIVGEVLREGKYPLTRGLTAAALVRLAGGFKRSADTQKAELASYEVRNGSKVAVAHRTIAIGNAVEGDGAADVALKPGDVLSIQQVNGWNDIGASVTVSGEVAHAGTYGIEHGEHLSDLIKRAGGFRDGAYPEGAVLERVQVRELDQKARQELITRIETTQPSLALVGDQSANLLAAFTQHQQAVVTRLKTQPANGRLVININPDVSKWQGTPADIEMRAGDTLVVPKRPGFVLISGQVSSPSAITFAPGRKAGWYLQRAGGVTEIGNKHRIFIVRANGDVIGNGSNVLSVTMQPGDTVVVPEKVVGTSRWKSLMNLAQVSSSLAIAARVATSF